MSASQAVALGPGLSAGLFFCGFRPQSWCRSLRLCLWLQAPVALGPGLSAGLFFCGFRPQSWCRSLRLCLWLQAPGSVLVCLAVAVALGPKLLVASPAVAVVPGPEAGASFSVLVFRPQGWCRPLWLWTYVPGPVSTSVAVALGPRSCVSL